jgi:hypothetical protein
MSTDSNSAGRPKFGRWELAHNPLLEASGVVYSDLGASQRSGAGFYITGSLYFNEGSLQFENGRCRFYVKEATLCAKCADAATFEPPTIAFRQEQRDKRTLHIDSLIETSKENSADAEAHGNVAFKVPWGLSAALGAGARAHIAKAEHASATAKESHTIIQSLVWANIRSRDDISWRIQADPANAVLHAGLTSPVLVGTRLLDSADGSLAYVCTSDGQGECSLTLEVRHVHIVITDFESDGKQIRDLGGELLRGRDKKAIVSRLALQKALEGAIPVGKLP